MNEDGNGRGFVVTVGTSFLVDVFLLLSGILHYSAQDLRQAMIENRTSNTPLTDLTMNFVLCDEPATARDDFVLFILEYIRSTSQNHLRKLTLKYAEKTALEPFFMAAAKSPTIRHLSLSNISCPIQDMVQFCRENRNIKILEMRDVNVLFEDDPNQAKALEMSTLSSMSTPLDELVLYGVRCMNPTSALIFADLVSLLNVSTISLGSILCGGVFEGNSETTQLATRVVSKIVESSAVKHIKFLKRWSRVSFSAALSAAKATVEELTVLSIGRGQIESLAKSIQEMAKVKVLRLVFQNQRVPLPPESKTQFLRAIDACATLTEIHVTDDSDDGNNFTQEEMQLLQDGRTERNNALGRLVANPDDVPEKELLKLMLRLEHCPTGRFQLARALPPARYRRGDAQTESPPVLRAPKKRKLCKK